MLLNKIIKEIDSANDNGWYSDDDISSLETMDDYKERQSQLRAANKVAKYLHEHKYDMIIPEHPLFVDEDDDEDSDSSDSSSKKKKKKSKKLPKLGKKRQSEYIIAQERRKDFFSDL